MAETLDLSQFIERSDAGTAHMTFAVDGVGCAGCIRKIESGLAKLPGVIDARLNFTQRRLAVDWRDDEIGAADIVAALEAIGYHAHPFAPERVEADDSRQAKWLLRCLAVAGFAAMNVMLLSISVWSGSVSDMTRGDARPVSLALGADRAAGGGLCGPAVLSKRVARRCARAQLNMDVPITVGVTLALALSLYETATHAVACLFRFRAHAVVLPAVRPLPRSGDAAQDQVVRRQSGIVQGGIRAPARWQRRA